MDEQKARQGEIAELMVKKKLEDLPPGYSVIANVDIAAEGKSSELDTVVVTPTGVIVVLSPDTWCVTMEPEVKRTLLNS